MDTRSFLHNHELNVMVFDEAFGQTMESTFEEDRRFSLPMTLQRRQEPTYLGNWWRICSSWVDSCWMASVSTSSSRSFIRSILSCRSSISSSALTLIS